VYPRFKSRKGRQSVRYQSNAFTHKDGQITLAKQDEPLEISWSRPLPEDAKLVSVNDVLAGLPPNSRALLRSSYYASVTEDPQNPLRVRLRQNAVDRWRPHAPLRVYHSPDDEEVPYEDALASVDRLRGRGADVTVEPLPGFDHVNSWIQAMPRAVTWFRSLD
jgi:fermentation-respiration switch protein FrsA (DUF1100 family)